MQGHRQVNSLPSKGGSGHEGGWGEAAVWSRDELSLQKWIKCLIAGIILLQFIFSSSILRMPLLVFRHTKAVPELKMTLTVTAPGFCSQQLPGRRAL